MSVTSMISTCEGRSLLAGVWLIGVVSLLGVPGPAFAADPSPSAPPAWQWVPEEGTCDVPVSMQEIREVLERTPAMIVGFENRAALTMLRGWAVRVPCLDTPATPRFLADLWYQIGMASLYTWNDLGELEGRGRDEVLAIFAKVQGLVPDYPWDTTSFGAFGRALWDKAREWQARTGKVVVALPERPSSGEIWVDGRRIQSGDRRLEVIPGTCLVQVREGKRLRGVWWVVAPGREAVLPIEHSEQVPRDRRPVGVSLLGGGWAFPLLYSGPSFYVHVPLKARLEVSIGTGGARLWQPGPGLWVVPVQVGLWWRSPARRLGWAAGAGYQGFLGGGFSAASTETEAGSDTPTWHYDVSTGWQSEGAAFAAHGPVVLGLVHLALGPWRVELRGSGGLVVWPGVMVAPQVQAAAGIGRRFGKEGAR